MAKHARLAASKTKQWSRCPGSLALDEADGYRDESGEAARLGTAAAGLLERSLRDGADPDAYMGRLIELVGEDEDVSFLRPGARWPKDPLRKVFEVDDDMASAVTVCTDYVRGRCRELGVQESRLMLERRVNPLPARGDTGGSGDVLIDAWPDCFETVDYKHGERVYVPAAGNDQTRSYSVGGMVEAGADVLDYGYVRNTIVQPRCHLSPPGGVAWEDVAPQEMLGWAAWLSSRADAVDDARALVAAGATKRELFDAGMLSAGEDGSHCAYCRHRPTCPAAIAQIQALAGADFEEPPRELHAPEDLGRLLPWLPFVEKWAAEAFAAAEAAAARGVRIPGRKAVRKRTQRKYRASLTPAQIADGVSAEFGLDRAGLFKDPELRPMGEVEKEVLRTAKGKGKAKKEHKEELAARYENMFLDKPVGGITVAPLDDPRPEVDVAAEAAEKAAADFE